MALSGMRGRRIAAGGGGDGGGKLVASWRSKDGPTDNYLHRGNPSTRV